MASTRIPYSGEIPIPYPEAWYQMAPLKHEGARKTQEMIFRIWALGFHPDLRPSSGRPCWKKLLRQRCNYGLDHACQPSFLDHPEMWYDRDTGRPVLITAHPYQVDRKEFNSFCHRHGFIGRVRRQMFSWYWPGTTYLVELRPTHG